MVSTPEVSIAFSNASWGLINAAFLSTPLETEAALERSVAAAAAFFTPRGRGWFYGLCDDMLAPGLREKASAVFAAHGLKRLMGSIGMVAERLRPPARPLPPIEVRHATDIESLRHIADLNAFAYAVPLEPARESVAVPACFQGDCRGYVGYVEGKPVSVAAVFRIDGVAYVGFVATHEEYRRRGYAEAIMRHGLEEARQLWGLERTVLHASAMGHSIYLRMGYRDVARFGFYLPAPAP